MSDDRLTAEERAIIEEAIAWRTHYPTNFPAMLADKVDALKASIHPQPVECLMSYWPDRQEDATGGWSATYPLDMKGGVGRLGELWRVTITPIERVR